ncbi:MAG: hypothetical protein JNM63_02660, partial [Spirochaetia bacterium]|nr:hypothetical protein [Spirochaetia bacterium]
MKNQMGKLLLVGLMLVSFSFAGGTTTALIKKDGKMMCCMDDGKMMAMDKDMAMGDMKVGTNGV